MPSPAAKRMATGNRRFHHPFKENLKVKEKEIAQRKIPDDNGPDL